MRIIHVFMALARLNVRSVLYPYTSHCRRLSWPYSALMGKSQTCGKGWFTYAISLLTDRAFTISRFLSTIDVCQGKDMFNAYPGITDAV